MCRADVRAGGCVRVSLKTKKSPANAGCGWVLCNPFPAAAQHRTHFYDTVPKPKVNARDVKVHIVYMFVIDLTKCYSLSSRRQRGIRLAFSHIVRGRAARYNEPIPFRKAAGSMAERWDAYLANGENAGRTLVRGEPIPEGLFHIVADVLVKHADGDYLVMQRDFRKEGFPGQFEAGASGSVLAGETPYQGAVRELKEETGIAADGLTFLFALSNLRETLYYCYVCLTDCDKQSVTLQEGETIAYRWLSEAAFLDFIRSDAFTSGQRERWLPHMDAVRAFGVE